MANFLIESAKELFKSLKPYQKSQGQSEGVSEIDLVSTNYLLANIYKVSSSKKQLIGDYKEMAMFPEVADAIDEIVTEAISHDKDNNSIHLNILDQNLLENENIVKNLQKEFDYIINKILDFNNNASELFKKFYIEGELYAELKVDEKEKNKGILGVQYLPAYTMEVEYDSNQDPKKIIQNVADAGVVVKKEDANGKEISIHKNIEFLPLQIAYVNSGMIDFQKNLVFSYLERAKIAYRQLKWMENALIIYRIVRAPERFVFYIDTGKLPKNKADEYVKTLIRKFQNKKVYNPSTGEVDVGKDTFSMEENFYLPVRNDGSGSKVETIGGGQNLGELSDVTYFLKKLYKALKIPTTRLDEANLYSYGRVGEATREEIKFSKYVRRIANRFIDFIYQVYFTHLQLKGLYQEYKIDRTKISIRLEEDSSWKEIKNLEMKKGRWELFKEMVELEDIFPKSYLLADIMNLSTEEINELKDTLKKEKEETPGEESPELNPEKETEGEGKEKKKSELMKG